MNDDKRFDFTEINKIQEEIDKSLNATVEVSEPLETLEDNNQISIFDKPIVAEEAIEPIEVKEVPEHMPQIAHAHIAQTPQFDSNFLNTTIKNQKPKGSKFKKAMALVIVGSLSMGFAAGFGGMFARSLFVGNNTTPATISEPFNFEAVSATPPVALAPVASHDLSFADLVDRIKPSVVAVTNYTTIQTFGGFFGGPGQSMQIPSAGSGIIFDESEERVYIVTNFHVIEQADHLGVSILESEDVAATIIGTSPESDLAVIAISKADLREVGIESVVIAEFADSDAVRAGDFVLSVGNALGEGNSATFGMVSAVNKEIIVEDRILTVIQTDAAINPGNSGGPLINLQGQVVGISTVKLAEISIDAVGFGITSNMAMPIIEDLRNEIRRPMLGIRGATVDERIAAMYNLPQLGVIIESVVENGSAEAAGIRRGDIITSFNGETIKDFENLIEKIAEHAVGDIVEITIVRDGTEVLVLSVELMARPIIT